MEPSCLSLRNKAGYLTLRIESFIPALGDADLHEILHLMPGNSNSTRAQHLAIIPGLLNNKVSGVYIIEHDSLLHSLPEIATEPEPSTHYTRATNIRNTRATIEQGI